MPDDRRVNGFGPEGAIAPAVDRAARLLREPVPVRAELRGAILAETRRAVLTHRAASAHAKPAWVGGKAARSALVISRPLAAAAAIALFVAGGAAATLASHSHPARVRQDSARAIATNGGGTITRFVLVAPDAHRVALVGDFNLWNPSTAPMRRADDTGAWVVEMKLPAGRHVYAFVVDGDVTADPSAPRTAGDDFGRPNSVVLVSPQS